MDCTEQYRRGDCQRNECKPPVPLKITTHHNANMYLCFRFITKKNTPKDSLQISTEKQTIKFGVPESFI